MASVRTITLLAVSESIKSLKDSKVRSGLTITLIAIGLMSLVGVLTAIDAIQAGVSSNMSQLGSSSFDITDKIPNRKHSFFNEPIKRPINYAQVLNFQMALPSNIPLIVSLTCARGITASSNRHKTNPNSSIIGGEESYLSAFNYTLAEGRNMNSTDVKLGRPVVIIGSDIKNALFPTESPIGKSIVVSGKNLLVIGSFKETTNMMGNSSGARILLMPMNQARKFKVSDGGFTLRILAKPDQMSTTQAISERILGRIRGDNPTQPNSFNIERNESAIESVNEIGDSLRVGGAIIGFITLLGACIGLLNIMIVSVKERTREIGIRKSLGATTNAIRIQFLAEAVVVSLIGAIFGVFLGILVGNIIPILTQSGVFVLPLNWMALGFFTSIVVGVLSGYYPANTAAKVDPVESLRYE